MGFSMIITSIHIILFFSRLQIGKYGQPWLCPKWEGWSKTQPCRDGITRNCDCEVCSFVGHFF